MDFQKIKKGKNIVMLTAYDFQMGRILAESRIELILVGDSLGMVLYGDEDTRSVSLVEMIRHGAAVVKGKKIVGSDSLVIVDMPFGSCDSVKLAVDNCRRMVEETGCDAVKIEGMPEIVKAVVEDGIAVVAHTGLKPQTAEKYSVQGGDDFQRREILAEAEALVEAGAFAMVLECVPVNLAREITEQISIPTIGIGAGKHCDGQVLVTYDLLGIADHKLPRFVRKFVDGDEVIKKAILGYQQAVRSGSFPSEKESYL